LAKSLIIKLKEYIEYVKGHMNSKNEIAPWVIKSHNTDKIISSHKTKKEAKEHLKQMKMYGANK